MEIMHHLFEIKNVLLVIPAAFLQHNIFSVDRPNYMNFATIGTVIGHELNHGFDSTARNISLIYN